MSKTTVYFNKNTVTKKYPQERRVFFNNEIFCLQQLKNNFVEKYSSKYPFPTILNIDSFNCTFTMNYCGESLEKNLFKHEKPKDLIPQLKNIFFNLVQNNILYKDIHPCNVCYTENTVFLIDFEVAFVMNCEDYPHINQFAKKGYKWSKKFYDSYYTKPPTFEKFDNLTDISEKREWKGQPWSIARMFNI